ncbi:O-antigen ligase family protein [Dyadobacter luticola]|uniref:O-antigen ligase family protein n=1 Tax=Dyadobacter luticola TaxID=1979387 RepID=A0A5R9KQ86_9BACT|nr:O-antigen ligase family protein [Dyadobacter luticola]
MVIVLIVSQIFPDLLIFGESTFQTIIVLTCYLYVALALFGPSRHRLFHVLSIPVFSQFLHLFQKYAFTAGANSGWRLLPFIMLLMYFFNFFLKVNVHLSRNEKLFLLTWITTQLGFLTISPNLANTVFGGLLFYLAILPLFFLYLHTLSEATDFQSKMEMYLCLLYFILGFGTFGLIFAGAAYKGSDNLLVTRNISDTNVTMAYFILLWPFALLFFQRNRLPTYILITLLGIFVGIVIFSFSRGAVFIVAPYLFITTGIIFQRRQIVWLAGALLVISFFFKNITHAFEDQGLGYSWGLRFGGAAAPLAAVQKLQASSGRAEIHAIAYDLFLKSPLFGHGTGSFEMLGPGYREAHSLLFTLLAEQGLIGTLYFYILLAILALTLIHATRLDKRYWLLTISLLFYLIFNHTVGSVFVIIPGKSITINCIAPILLLCLFFYSRSAANIPDQNG